ncbi:MAG: helix-turn-helix transcriptional regulator [Pseudomonadota bacterium]|nr:helix-turn-helix transcriptional regulator [Pseudomonadota bacterium]
MPHPDFRDWVFDELSKILQLDSALWYRWAAQADKSHLHAWYLYKQPESLIHEYTAGELWKEDVVYLKAAVGPRGIAVHASYDDYTSERMRAFLKRYRQAQVLTIGIVQEVPQIAAGMSLYRNETREPFSAEDVATIEAVTPHTIDAWRENWLGEVVRGARSIPEPQEFSLAVLMPDMMMSEAQDNFGELMHLEWPTWQGPWLPEALQARLASSHEPYTGRGITVYRKPQPDKTSLLLVRRSHPLDQLAPRKKAVALMFARGATQTEVAQRLSLSTSTVNNYLGEVYHHLDVSDKVDLSILVNRLEP